jgi:hypothetical protein
MKTSNLALQIQRVEDQPRPYMGLQAPGASAAAQVLLPRRAPRPRTSLSFRTGRTRAQRLELFRVY